MPFAGSSCWRDGGLARGFLNTTSSFALVLFAIPKFESRGSETFRPTIPTFPLVLAVPLTPAPNGEGCFGETEDTRSRERAVRSRETDRPGSASNFSLEGDGRKPWAGPASGTGKRDKRGIPEGLVGVEEAALK
jgi:hypothetical protein